jgi:sarcosine oxidase subunit gamma
VHDLAPLTTLGGVTARVDTHGGVTLSENTGHALASVAARRGQEAACNAHLEALLEGPAPDPGKCRLHDPEVAFWIAPDQWMVCAPFDTHEDLAARLTARFGHTASITEQSDVWACFDLKGPDMGAVMELCCNIDLAQMQTGDATRTTIHHLGCYVLRQDPPNHLRIFGPRASAPSLHHALLTAMKAAL